MMFSTYHKLFFYCYSKIWYIDFFLYIYIPNLIYCKLINNKILKNLLTTKKVISHFISFKKTYKNTHFHSFICPLFSLNHLKKLIKIHFHCSLALFPLFRSFTVSSSHCHCSIHSPSSSATAVRRLQSTKRFNSSLQMILVDCYCWLAYFALTFAYISWLIPIEFWLKLLHD